MTAQDATARAGKITGLRFKGLGTPEEQEFERLLEQRALDAARTGQSTDPRLLRELAESEGEIRARLARQFGSDYENTTAGAMALNAFRQRKAESLADFARKDIGLADVALQHRATLGNLAGQQMGLALAPSDTRFSTSTQFQNLSTSFQKFGEMLQYDRLAQFGAKRDRALAEYQADQARTAAIAGSLNQLASGAGSFASYAALNKAAPAKT
jgi:hypothetical protein